MPTRTKFDHPAELPNAPHLTVRQVANYLSLSQSEVYDLVALNDLPHCRIGKSIRIPRLDFLAWYRQHLSPRAPRLDAPTPSAPELPLFAPLAASSK